MALRNFIPNILSSRHKHHLAQPPGSLVHFGAKRSDGFSIRSIRYNFESHDINDNDDLPELSKISPDRVDFYEILGLHEVEKISRVGKAFSLNSLVVEDILNTTARSKIEKRDENIFVICKLLTYDSGSAQVEVQQCSFVLLPDNVLLSFLEAPTGAFDPVLERIRTGLGGRIRKYGADYLLWALLDAVVDNYLYVIDQLDKSIIETEDILEQDPDKTTTTALYNLKRDIGQLYRMIRPIREIAAGLTRSNSDLLTSNSDPFFVDLNDHAVQVIETTEDLRESASALRDFHLSIVSHRMNEVMKVLTCFSTIFLPLTFIAGIYGMNFKWMPELELKWGYPLVWCFFFCGAATMFWLFRKKRWI
jgi:magnesium transporter